MPGNADSLAVLRLTREERAELVARVQDYFRVEHGYEVGNLGAEGALRFFAELLGPFAYNQAIADARVLVAQRAEAIDEDLFGLTRPLPRR